jgi:hypothetical protein
VLAALNNPSVKVVVKRYFDKALPLNQNHQNNNEEQTMPTQNNNPVTIKFWETEQRRLSEKMQQLIGVNETM